MSESPDTYYTVAGSGESVYREKASKFIGLAFPVGSEAEAKEMLQTVRKRYFDANHHCFAYCLGQGMEVYRFNDDGEPSGSAGRPIYGQLVSRGISDTLVVVARYFGGTKLGIPGLIHAYRQAASDALENAGKTEKVITLKIMVTFPYANMNHVMKIQKEEELEILEQSFDNECRISLGVRRSRMEIVQKKLMQYKNIYILLYNSDK